jgi:hypothetical protein
MPVFGPAGFNAHNSKNELDQKCDSAANQCHDKNSQKRKTQMMSFVKFNYPADDMFHLFAFTPFPAMSEPDLVYQPHLAKLQR